MVAKVWKFVFIWVVAMEHFHRDNPEDIKIWSKILVLVEIELFAIALTEYTERQSRENP